MRFAAASRGSGALLAATVDHGLRPESRAECEAVAAWAQACGLPHRILAWEGPKPRTRVQEAAREARYALLVDLARAIGAARVLTAHTLDDQAETVLMRVARGTGIAGLGGMRRETERDGIVIARPLLGVEKARLAAACAVAGWPFHEDPSNVDPRFARARVRKLAPLLAAEGLTSARLVALAERARQAEEALAVRADQVFAAARLDAEHGSVALNGALLAREPDAILVRAVARGIAEALGPRAAPLRLERLEARVLGDLRRALLARERLRLTLAGALLEVDTDCRLTLRREPERRRGRV
jgi:tRNA(Ile)-lysidine synthase